MTTPMSELNAALRDAREPDEIIAAVARVAYRRAHPGRDCPDGLPDERALMHFLRVPESDPDYADGLWRPVRSDWLTKHYGAKHGGGEWAWTIGVRQFPYRDGFRGGLAAFPWPVEGKLETALRFIFVEDVHSAWLALPEDECGRHPLGAFVAAWQDANKPAVDAETRPDKRILPRITGGDEHPAREIGMLFAGLHEGRRIQQPELPLWPGVPARKRVPLLDVVDAAGVPVVQRGGAPIPLRLFVRALSAVRPSDRGQPSVRLAVKVGDLLDALWPAPEGRKHGWRAGRHWPVLCQTLESVSKYAINDGKGRWFPLALRYLPNTLRLDDDVVLDVAFPPGATSGPPVALPVMDRLMVQSAARWRAFIAAHCIAWIPGTTRVPVMRKGAGGRMVKTGRHTWTRDVSAYPVLTLDDRRRLAFGVDLHGRERAKVDAAFRDLPGLVVLDEAAQDERHGEAGFRIVPEGAMDAIGRKQ